MTYDTKLFCYDFTGTQSLSLKVLLDITVQKEKGPTTDLFMLRQNYEHCQLNEGAWIPNTQILVLGMPAM